MIQLNGNITLVVGETYQLTVNNLELTMPYSDIKHSIDISLGVGVTTYKLKFPDLGNGTKVQGLLNGVSIKAGKDVTLTSSTSLKSYKRGTVTYWSIEVIANPVVVVEDNNVPQIGLLAIDPNNINTTDDIPEGVVNLYYLDSRARESISATAPIDYDNVTGVISTELTQYTNADVGLLFTNGVHTGISFTAQANRINATVSLSGFSLDALSDVVLGGLGLQTGQVLKYSANKWINTKLLSTELSDSDLLMRRADNLNNLGNVATARNNLGLGSAALLDSNVVITTSSNIGDLGNVMLANLVNGHILKYSSATDKWFNTKLGVGDIEGLVGVYAPINSPTFTGIPQAPAPANNSNSTQIATTAWVKARIAEGGGGGGGGATQLNDLSDVNIDDLTQAVGQTLRFNGVEYVNAKLASTDLSNSASIVLANTAPHFITQGQGDNSTKVATTAYVDTAVGGVSSDKIDAIITSAGFNNDGTKPNYSSTNYILNTDSLLVATGKIDTQLKSTQDEVNTIESSLGLNANGSRPVYTSTNYILNTETHHVAISNLDSALFNVESSLGTASGYDVGNNNNQLPLAQDVALLGRAVNSFTGSIKIAGDGSQAISLFNGIFPLFSVNGSGNVLTEGTLQVTGTSNLSSILIQPGHTIQNLLGGQVSFGAGGITTIGPINGHDITASGILSGNSLTITTTSSLGTASANTPNASDNSTRVATTAYVQNELSSFSTSLEGLSDVNLTDLLANEVLLYNGIKWVNSGLDINLINGLGSSATLDTTDVLLVANNLNDLNDVPIARNNLGLGSSATLNAGTHAGEVLLISVNDTLPILSGVNLTGVLKTSQAGLPNGIATLDNTGKLSSDQLPDIAITFVDVVANEGDKPAAGPENIGHVYIVTSTSKTYISDGTTWVELLSASDLAIASAQTEIDRMETAIGLAINGDFIPFNGTNYLDTAETITESLTLLDTEIKANSDTLGSFGDIVNLDTTDVFQVVNAFSEIGADFVAQGNARTHLGLGSSAVYNAGTIANTVLLLDVNGAIDSSILNKAITIGGVNIGDIVTINDTVNALIDIPTLKNDLALASTDLTDSDNLPRLDAVLNTFIGDINANSLEVTTSLASDSLTVATTSSLAEAYATTPNPNEDSNRVATTAWVRGVVSETIGATTLNELTDVVAPNPLTNEVLIYNGTNWVNSVIDIAIVDGAGTSVTYDVGTGVDNIVLLDNTGAISSVILDRATSIGGLLITDILTLDSNITALIDIPTLKNDLALASTDLTDSVNLPRLDAVLNTFTGDLTVQGVTNLGESYVTTPNANDDSTRIASTEWVVDYVGNVGGATTLDQLTDVVAPNPLASEALIYNGTNWVNSGINISIISGTGSSATYDAGVNANEVLLLDNTGAIDSNILNLATTIGGLNVGDILTVNDDINALIDIPTLKTDLDLSITDLNDVDIAGIDVNQTLVWDGAKFIPVYTNSLLVDNQGRYIEAFDCGLVTDLVVGSSMDFQDASGTGGTPLNAEDLFLNTVYFSQEDYGPLIG